MLTTSWDKDSRIIAEFCEAVRCWYKCLNKENSCRWLEKMINEGYCDKQGLSSRRKRDLFLKEFNNFDQCLLLDIDPLFPLPVVGNTVQREKQIFDVLKYCLDHLKPPTISEFIAFDAMTASKKFRNKSAPSLTKPKYLNVYIINKSFIINEEQEHDEYVYSSPIPTSKLRPDAPVFVMSDASSTKITIKEADEKTISVNDNQEQKDCNMPKRNTKDNKKFSAGSEKYQPDSEYRAKRNIKISKVSTEKEWPDKIAEKHIVFFMYDYMDKDVALAEFCDLQSENGQIIRIYNIDLHDCMSNELYLVVQKIDHTVNKTNFQWLSVGLLCANEIKKRYNIMELGYKLPQSLRKTSKFLQQLNVRCMTFLEGKQIIENTKWHKIPILFRVQNVKRLTLSVLNKQFIKMCFSNLNNKQDDNTIKLIPILLFGDDNKTYFIEYVWIISLDDDTDIAISLQYQRKKDKFIAKGIHLTKDIIQLHHSLAMPSCNQCCCLSNFTSNIHSLTIGNPDNVLNQMKQYKKKFEEWQQFGKSMIQTCPDSEFAKQAKYILSNGRK